MNQLSRRHLLGALPLAAAGKGSFYRIEAVKGRQCFVDPAGRPFFSIGMNHIDSSPLRSNETWRKDFGNDIQRWLKTVHTDLLAWGFNSVGWVQEFVSISKQHHRHSRIFTLEEFRWLNMPFIESHQG